MSLELAGSIAGCKEGFSMKSIQIALSRYFFIFRKSILMAWKVLLNSQKAAGKIVIISLFASFGLLKV